ncbi:DUF4249 domain-containing protein [Hymenobacter sp. BT635]|uniref:DUF4249 domain-containing protein n=1 Tax=Hymenobacter nitidus TaxID=2880929 RepID=A0ABS8AHM8_9BACT|nr:DUF4249 domain-containing protein [Hymenobacter nitidus]MCB2379928.1 DUF4249 domain-containing protein [Hymenobacter nitidus]
MSLSNLPARVAALLLLSLPLGACETTLDLPEPEHTPRIALQYSLSNYDAQAQAGSENDELARVRRLYVSNSQRVFDLRQLRGRQDATVVIVDESGAVVESFLPVPPRSAYPGDTFDIGYYQPTMSLKGEPGRTYTLRASLPGFETVESTQTMPKAPVIESATFTKDQSASNPNDVYGRLAVTIADDPNVTNYYVAFARVVDKNYKLTTGWAQVQPDERDSNGDITPEVGQFQLSSIGAFAGSGYYGFYPYADTNVNGKRFGLTADVRYYPGCPSSPGCTEAAYMEVFVSSLTRDAYNFYLSRQRYTDTEFNPFAEPAPLVSNLKNGYGLFGGITDAVYRIKL